MTNSKLLVFSLVAFLSILECHSYIIIPLHRLPVPTSQDVRFKSVGANVSSLRMAASGAEQAPSRLGRLLKLHRAGGALVAGQEVLTLGSKATGFAFTVGTLFKGIACSFAPSRSLKFIGLEKSATKAKDVDKEDLDRVPSAVEFLVTWSGGFSMATGLSAALALNAESAVRGHIPGATTMFRCIYIGLMPMFGVLMKLISMKRWPDTLYLNSKKNVTSGLILGLVISALTIAGKIEPEMPTLCLSLVFLILGINAIRDPSTVFRLRSALTEGEELAYDVADVAKDETVGQLADDAVSAVTQTMEPEESLIARKFGLTTITYAVLVHMLRNPVVNALPSIGFAALTQALGNLYIALGTDDVKNCNMKKDGILASAAGSLAVAAVCLRHFLLQ
jgi:hypothetical protein